MMDVPQNVPNAGCGAKAEVLIATRAATRRLKRKENLAMVATIVDDNTLQY
jgi:hypothetical protein